MTSVMIITGAGRGIGASTARLAARRGYAVAINYRRDHRAAEALVDEIRESGGQALAVQADAADEAGIRTLFETVDAELGRPDVLVNNAGMVDVNCRVEDMDAARIERMLRVNVTGPLLCAREAVKRMSTRRGGRGGAIVNVSSAAARLGGADEYVDYAASKGAIDSVTRGLAREVADEGIRVNGVRPGVIRTSLHAGADNPDKVEAAAERIPLGRVGEPEEIASAILWLAESGFSTGAILDIDGGV
ncbi:SDR family oxidoreductase [Halomonas koreensis]|uniref:SDR family oxidoreductase n=1 Tax=Halomonas koreensis TaxID=245385 RepID=A0ABU1FXY9_9GAMM|nr:SDR family oxidoreductase [Halomonas koreensis]MDR5865218.1 SDR family oxidoreductase [Halomonas koreensis]